MEKAAENLVFARMEKPMELEIEIAKMRGVDFLEGISEVPISKEVLEEIKGIAEKTRNKEKTEQSGVFLTRIIQQSTFFIMGSPRIFSKKDFNIFFGKRTPI